VVPVESGGHFSHHELGAAGIRRRRAVALPVDAERQDVDVAALPEFLARERTQLIVLGGSVQLCPNEVRAVARRAGEIGARVLFDAAHTAGLVAGGEFPQSPRRRRRRGQLLDLQELRWPCRRRHRQVYVSAMIRRDELGLDAAVRLGVQELVRRGLGPAEMPQVARVVGGLVRADLAMSEARALVAGLHELMTEPSGLNRSWPLDAPAAVTAAG
jgi:glycine/serine hydroxymethyltransferase